jgi:hypothetical protein
MSVFHQEYFKEMLRQHVIWAIIVPFYPKDEFAWMEKIDLHPFVKELEYHALCKMLKYELEFKWKKCKYLWSTGDHVVPPKIASHVIRYILHAIDLMTLQTIPDFTYGNEWWDSVRLEQFNTWEQYETKYKKIADSFMEKLDGLSSVIDEWEKHEASLVASWGAAIPVSDPKKPRICVLDFISKFGFKALRRVRPMDDVHSQNVIGLTLACIKTVGAVRTFKEASKV